MQVRARLARELPLRTVSNILGSAIWPRHLCHSANPASPAHDRGRSCQRICTVPVDTNPAGLLVRPSGSLPLGEVSCHLYEELKLSDLDAERFASAWRGPLRVIRCCAPSSRRQANRWSCRRCPTSRSYARISPRFPVATQTGIGSHPPKHVASEARSGTLAAFDMRGAASAGRGLAGHLSIDALILDGESIGLCCTTY